MNILTIVRQTKLCKFMYINMRLRTIVYITKEKRRQSLNSETIDLFMRIIYINILRVLYIFFFCIFLVLQFRHIFFLSSIHLLSISVSEIGLIEKYARIREFSSCIVTSLSL